MLVCAGFYLAAPFLWQADGCCVVILDLISTVSSGQVDAVAQTWVFSALAVCELRF